MILSQVHGRVPVSYYEKCNAPAYEATRAPVKVQVQLQRRLPGVRQSRTVLKKVVHYVDSRKNTKTHTPAHHAPAFVRRLSPRSSRMRASDPPTSGAAIRVRRY